MSTSFADLGCPASIVDGLAERGITEPFPIQRLSIPEALAGRDVCGKAPTGSGKTLAFGIPLAERVSKAQPKRPRALVLAPTRELAAQIRDELEPLLAAKGRTVGAVFGGVGFGPQHKMLRRGVDVVVACPGRLADLVRSGEAKLDEVEIAVLDEADRMADMGFLPEVRRLLDQVRPDRQTLLFSATLDGDIDVLIRNYQRDPHRCEIAAVENEIDRDAHEWLVMERGERVRAAAELIENHGSTVVFCRTKHGADRIAKQLARAGVTAVPIHGGRSQGQRTRALAQFTDGKAQALVATDVAARGIHVDDVACVIHFDPAGDHKDYIHRSGRTGRAGADGVVVSLVASDDMAAARMLQRDLGVAVLPGGSEAEDRRAIKAKRSGGGQQRGGGSRRGGSGGSNGSARRNSSPRRQGGGERSGRNRSGGPSRSGRGRSQQRRSA